MQRQQEANETIGNEVTPDQSADLQDKETPKDFYILKRMNENQSMFSEKSQKSPNPLRNNNGVFPLQNRDNFGNPEVITSLNILKCWICEKAFISGTNFMNHIRMHKRNKDSNVRIFTIEEPETCSNEGTGLRENQGNGHSKKKQNSHWNNNKLVRTKSLSSTGTQPSSVKEEEIVVIADGDIDDVVIRHDEIKG